MAAIQHLLQRWGFVKLGRYGLVLTPEGRIRSLRPAVLDDGSGGRIVGWEADDLAMAELQPWEPARPAARRAAARRAATAQIPPVRPAPPVATQITPVPAASPPQAASRPAYQAVISEASVLAQRPVDDSEPVMAVAVAPEPTVDEDDWEWTIALARARAATAELGTLRAALPSGTREPASTRGEPVTGASRTRPIAVVATRDPATSGEWPKTAPVGAIDYEAHSRTATRPAMPIPRVVPAAPVLPPAAAPVTVIPVPVLPTMHSTARAGRLEPVVRAHAPATSPRRFPKGTGPVNPRPTSRMAATAATAAMSDDTVPNMSVGDRTTPGIALPPAARAVELPSIKRRTVTR